MSKIAFLDSGIGGINVLKEALKILPNEHFIYFADNKNAPYGPRTKEEIRGFVTSAVGVLVKQDIKALVIACNAATSASASFLRKTHNFPIIGMEPAIKPAVEKYVNTNKRILVLATEITLNEEKFRQLVADINAHHLIEPLAFPELVTFAEDLEFSSEKVKACLRQKLSPYKLDEFGAVVLGCTHFLFYKSILNELLPKNIEIFDGACATVKHLHTILLKNKHVAPATSPQKVEFIFSGIPRPDIEYLLINDCKIAK